MFHSRREKFAVWSKRILLTGFVLSFLGYIGAFIVPTIFDLQVVVAPQLDNYNQKSLYYLKHVRPTDIHKGDVLVYMDESSRPIRTTVTGLVKNKSIPTLVGTIKYEQSIGVKQQEVEALGEFYAFSLSETGRKMVVIYVTVVLLINYLLSYWLPRTPDTTTSDLKIEMAETAASSATIIVENPVEETTAPEQVREPQALTLDEDQQQDATSSEIVEIKTFAKTHSKQELVDYFITNWLFRENQAPHPIMHQGQAASKQPSLIEKFKGQKIARQLPNQKQAAPDKSASLPKQGNRLKAEVSAVGKTKRFGRYQSRHSLGPGKHSSKK